MNPQKYLKFSLELLLTFWVVRMTPGGLICSTPSPKLRVPPSVPSYNNRLHNYTDGYIYRFFKFSGISENRWVYIHFFSSVFRQLSKANLWPPKAAGNFVVFLTKFLKQMLQNFGILMSIYIYGHIYIFSKISRILGIYIYLYGH